MRFLLQRLDEAVRGGARARRPGLRRTWRAEAARHVGLGADASCGPGDGWVVLRDPNGHEYCCTGRDPLTGGADPG